MHDVQQLILRPCMGDTSMYAVRAQGRSEERRRCRADGAQRPRLVSFGQKVPPHGRHDGWCSRARAAAAIVLRQRRPTFSQWTSGPPKSLLQTDGLGPLLLGAVEVLGPSTLAASFILLACLQTCRKALTAARVPACVPCSWESYERKEGGNVV